MTPRRKKADEAEESAKGGTSFEAEPKKKAVHHRKAAPVEAAKPPSAEPAPSAPSPVVPPKPEPRVIPFGMKIESVGAPPADLSAGAPENEEEPAPEAAPESPRPFGVPKTPESNLATPPRFLMQSRKFDQGEVEDVLEEPEEREQRLRASFHPPVKTGLYRKIALIFGALALVVAALAAYVAYSRATVIIYPKLTPVTTTRKLDVSAKPADDQVPGEVQEVSVSGEMTAAPSGSGSVESAATGFVTLYNKTASPITLVPTTRLLTSDGVLFRMKDRMIVPASGSVKAAVYADKPGPSGEIGPSDFTIPGLPANLQKVIYAKSAAPMTGGASAGGVVMPEDIQKLFKDLNDELVAQAKDEVGKKVSGTWSGQVFVVDPKQQTVNVTPGQTTSQIIARISVKVTSISFDKAKAVDLASADLKKQKLATGMELTGVDAEQAQFEAVDGSVDASAGKAQISVSLSGEAGISLDNPLFDADKLKGLYLKAVDAYFQGIEGVDRVDIVFRPFWIKRMPDLKDHITFKLAK